MRNIQGIVSLLFGCLLLIWLWPFLVGLVGIVVLVIGLAFAYLVYQNYKARKSGQDGSEYYESKNTSSDVIDVDYTERTIDDKEEQ